MCKTWGQEGVRHWPHPFPQPLSQAILLDLSYTPSEIFSPSDRMQKLGAERYDPFGPVPFYHRRLFASVRLGRSLGFGARNGHH